MNQRNSQHRKWSCLIWGGTVGFWGFGPKHRMVLEGCSSCTESNLVLPCNLWWGKRSYYSDITVSFKRVDRIESSRESEPVPLTSGMSEIAVALHLLLLTILQLTLLACSLDASSWMPVVPLHFSKSCTVRWKMFSLFFAPVFYVLFVWEVLWVNYNTVQYYQLC